MIRRITLIASVVALLTGCAAKVPMASKQDDETAKAFATKQGVAGLYIYRNESLGKAVKLNIELDGKSLGQTGHCTYFYQDLKPGAHIVTSRAENTSEISINAVAQKLYFVWQEVKMGLFSPRTQLQLVDEATGKKGVSECELAQPAKQTTN